MVKLILLNCMCVTHAHTRTDPQLTCLVPRHLGPLADPVYINALQYTGSGHQRWLTALAWSNLICIMCIEKQKPPSPHSRKSSLLLSHTQRPDYASRLTVIILLCNYQPAVALSNVTPPITAQEHIPTHTGTLHNMYFISPLTYFSHTHVSWRGFSRDSASKSSFEFLAQNCTQCSFPRFPVIYVCTQH